MKNESGLQVTGDKVLVRPMKFETKSAAGIIVVDQTKDREEMAQQMGWLVGIGPKALGEPELEGISLGDLVLFPRYQNQMFPVDGEMYWILRVSSILGKATRLPDSVFRGAEGSVQVFGMNEQKVA
jgi:co-chaperonin GroES (HSP10)